MDELTNQVQAINAQMLSWYISSEEMVCSNQINVNQVLVTSNLYTNFANINQLNIGDLNINTISRENISPEIYSNVKDSNFLGPIIVNSKIKDVEATIVNVDVLNTVDLYVNYLTNAFIKDAVGVGDIEISEPVYIDKANFPNFSVVDINANQFTSQQLVTVESDLNDIDIKRMNVSNIEYPEHYTKVSVGNLNLNNVSFEIGEWDSTDIDKLNYNHIEVNSIVGNVIANLVDTNSAKIDTIYANYVNNYTYEGDYGPWIYFELEGLYKSNFNNIVAKEWHVPANTSVHVGDWLDPPNTVQFTIANDVSIDLWAADKNEINWVYSHPVHNVAVNNIQVDNLFWAGSNANYLNINNLHINRQTSWKFDYNTSIDSNVSISQSIEATNLYIDNIGNTKNNLLSNIDIGGNVYTNNLNVNDLNIMNGANINEVNTIALNTNQLNTDNLTSVNGEISHINTNSIYIANETLDVENVVLNTETTIIRHKVKANTTYMADGSISNIQVEELTVPNLTLNNLVLNTFDNIRVIQNLEEFKVKKLTTNNLTTESIITNDNLKLDNVDTNTLQTIDANPTNIVVDKWVGFNEATSKFNNVNIDNFHGNNLDIVNLSTNYINITKSIATGDKYGAGTHTSFNNLQTKDITLRGTVDINNLYAPKITVDLGNTNIDDLKALGDLNYTNIKSQDLNSNNIRLDNLVVVGDAGPGEVNKLYINDMYTNSANIEVPGLSLNDADIGQTIATDNWVIVNHNIDIDNLYVNGGVGYYPFGYQPGNIYGIFTFNNLTTNFLKSKYDNGMFYYIYANNANFEKIYGHNLFLMGNVAIDNLNTTYANLNNVSIEQLVSNNLNIKNAITNSLDTGNLKSIDVSNITGDIMNINANNLKISRACDNNMQINLVVNNADINRLYLMNVEQSITYNYLNLSRTRAENIHVNNVEIEDTINTYRVNVSNLNTNVVKAYNNQLLLNVNYLNTNHLNLDITGGNVAIAQLILLENNNGIVTSEIYSDNIKANSLTGNHLFGIPNFGKFVVNNITTNNVVFKNVNNTLYTDNNGLIVGSNEIGLKAKELYEITSNKMNEIELLNNSELPYDAVNQLINDNRNLYIHLDHEIHAAESNIYNQLNDYINDVKTNGNWVVDTARLNYAIVQINSNIIDELNNIGNNVNTVNSKIFTDTMNDLNLRVREVIPSQLSISTNVSDYQNSVYSYINDINNKYILDFENDLYKFNGDLGLNNYWNNYNENILSTINNIYNDANNYENSTNYQLLSNYLNGELWKVNKEVRDVIIPDYEKNVIDTVNDVKDYRNNINNTLNNFNTTVNIDTGEIDNLENNIKNYNEPNLFNGTDMTPQLINDVQNMYNNWNNRLNSEEVTYCYLNSTEMGSWGVPKSNINFFDVAYKMNAVNNATELNKWPLENGANLIMYRTTDLSDLQGRHYGVGNLLVLQIPTYVWSAKYNNGHDRFDAYGAMENLSQAYNYIPLDLESARGMFWHTNAFNIPMTFYSDTITNLYQAIYTLSNVPYVNINVPNVVDMRGGFQVSGNLNVNSYAYVNAPNVVYIENAFASTLFKDITFIANGNKVQDWHHFAYRCWNLVNVNIIGEVKGDCNVMLSQSNNLQRLNWDLGNVTRLRYTLETTQNIQIINNTNFTTGTLSNFASAFSSIGFNTENNWDFTFNLASIGPNSTEVGRLFTEVEGINSLTFTHFNASKRINSQASNINYYYYFTRGTKLNGLAFENCNFYVDDGTNMRVMWTRNQSGAVSIAPTTLVIKDCDVNSTKQSWDNVQGPEVLFTGTHNKYGVPFLWISGKQAEIGETTNLIIDNYGRLSLINPGNIIQTTCNLRLNNVSVDFDEPWNLQNLNSLIVDNMQYRVWLNNFSFSNVFNTDGGLIGGSENITLGIGSNIYAFSWKDNIPENVVNFNFILGKNSSMVRYLPETFRGKDWYMGADMRNIDTLRIQEFEEGDWTTNTDWTTVYNLNLRNINHLIVKGLTPIYGGSTQIVARTNIPKFAKSCWVNSIDIITKPIDNVQGDGTISNPWNVSNVLPPNLYVENCIKEGTNCNLIVLPTIEKGNLNDKGIAGSVVGLFGIFNNISSGYGVVRRTNLDVYITTGALAFEGVCKPYDYGGTVSTSKLNAVQTFKQACLGWSSINFHLPNTRRDIFDNNFTNSMVNLSNTSVDVRIKFYNSVNWNDKIPGTDNYYGIEGELNAFNQAYPGLLDL